MAEASVIPIDSASEGTTVRLRLRWVYHRMRRTILPRRWAIRREIKDNSRYYARQISEARARKARGNEIEGIRAAEANEYWMLEEELEMLESRRLLDQANKLMLPTPEHVARDWNDDDDDPNWRKGTTFKPHWYLRREAMQKLRAKILADRKARLEPLHERVKFVGAVVGGLGGAAYLSETLMKLLRS